MRGSSTLHTICAFLLLTTSCARIPVPVQSRTFQARCVFNASICQLQKATTAARYQMLEGELIDSLNTSVHFGKKYLPLLEVDSNRHDIMILNGYMKDSVYFVSKKEKESMRYFVDLQVHFSPISAGRTAVTVLVHDPMVIVRESLLPVPPHFVRTAKTRPVTSTNKEAYDFLQVIGRELGQVCP